LYALGGGALQRDGGIDTGRSLTPAGTGGNRPEKPGMGIAAKRAAAARRAALKPFSKQALVFVWGLLRANLARASSFRARAVGNYHNISGFNAVGFL
jgi:hypothetical protein